MPVLGGSSGPWTWACIGTNGAVGCSAKTTNGGGGGGGGTTYRCRRFRCARTAKDITIAVGTSIQGAINNEPAGTTFCLPAGTWNGQTFTPQSNDIFIGDPGGGTILDGGGGCPNGYYDVTNGNGISGVQLFNLTIQRYGICPGPHPEWGGENWTPQLIMGPGWIAENIVVQNGGGEGVHLDANSILGNSRILSEGCVGIASGNSYSNVLIEGNEIAYNNTQYPGSLDAIGACGGLKIVQNTNQKLLANYVHDNAGPGLWSDIFASGWTISGNTIINNTESRAS